MIVDVFLKPLETVVNVLLSRHDRKEDREAKTEADRQLALNNLFIALTRTIAYNETIPEGRDRSKELELSTLWYTAMAGCRPYFEDQDLYWMWHKSLFWMTGTDPRGEKLSDEELRSLHIDLTTVREKVGKMTWMGDVKKHVKAENG